MDFQPKSVYAFDIYGAELINTDFKRTTVLAVMDASTARSWPGHDVDATHALIRPYLPANALKELSDYTFLLVELPSKAKTLVAVQWIVQDTVEKITGIGLRITTNRDLSNSQVERIREFFSQVAIPVEMEVL